MWRIWMVWRLTLVKKNVFILFVVCINCLFICSMLKNHFVMNRIVEMTLICPMPMEEDPSTIMMDDDE